MKSIQLVLVSERGMGQHYNGPATNAFRTFGSMTDRSLAITLLHAHKLQEADGPVGREIYLGSDFTFISRLLFPLKGIWWLSRHRRNVDVVQTVDALFPSLAILAFARLIGCATIVRVAAHRNELSGGRYMSKMVRLLTFRYCIVRSCSGCVAISDAIADEFSEIGVPLNRIWRIRNGVDIHRFSPASREAKANLRRMLNLSDRGLIVLFVGKICRRKQPHVIIEGIRALRNDGVDVFGLFVGPNDNEDPEYASIINAAAENLHEVLCFTGHVPDPESYYQLSDVFCLPSTKEGMSNALVEAFACGLPALVSKVSGSEDVLTEGDTGFFISDVDDFVRYVKMFDEERSSLEVMGSKCRDFAVDWLDVSTVCDKYVSMYRAVLDR